MIRKTEGPSLRTMAGLPTDFKTDNIKQIYGVRKAISETNHLISILIEEMRLIRLQGGKHYDL
jgi:hypothetical protein